MNFNINGEKFKVEVNWMSLFLNVMAGLSFVGSLMTGQVVYLTLGVALMVYDEVKFPGKTIKEIK